MESFDGTEDAQTRQARILLDHLMSEIVKLSRSIEQDEHSTHHSRSRGLRAELYEAHRQVDQLCRRFPATEDQVRRASLDLFV